MLTSNILNRISFFDKNSPDLTGNSLCGEENTEVCDSRKEVADADVRILGCFFEGFLSPERIVKIFRSEIRGDEYFGDLVLMDEKNKITISATTIKGPCIQIVISDHGRCFFDKGSLIKACRDFEEAAIKNGIVRFSKKGYSFLMGKDHIYNLITG